MPAAGPRRRRVGLAAFGALLPLVFAPATPAAAAGSVFPTVTPTEIGLGTLPGGTDSRALGEDEAGQVVGWSYTSVGGHSAVHAFSWTRRAGMVDLSSLVSLGGKDSAASEISDNGRIAGYSFTVHELPNAYSWTQQLGLIDLGTLPGGGESRATRVNKEGQVVGWADTTSIPAGADSGIRHAFSWTKAGGMIDLGTFGGSASTAAGVSDSGQVVGYSDLADGAWHAFSWTPATGMVDLGTLGGSTSTAHAINDDGQIVGQSTTANNGPTHAFFWTRAGGMIDVGTLGGSTSVARGVSDNGQVVGYSQSSNGATHAFSWTKTGGMIDLAPLAGASGSYAEAVNDSGQVIGYSTDAAGHNHATLWQLPVVRLSALAMTPARFRAKRSGPTAYLKVKADARIKFRLSAPSLVTLTVDRVLSGRRGGKRCLPGSPGRARRPRCTLHLLRGSFRVAGHSGLNAVPLSVERLDKARLPAGAYILSATAPSPNGTLSGPVHFRFTVKPPRP